MTEWYYSKMGLQQGPVPEDELVTKIRRGEIDGTNLIWKDGMAEWKPLSQMPELLTLSNPGVPSDNPTQYPGTTGGSIPLTQPPAFQGHYTEPFIPSYFVPTIVSLVLWVIFMAIFCFPVGLPCSIVALVYGTKVDSLRAQRNLVAAQAASRAAKVWMIVSYCLFALPILGVIGVLVFVILQ